MTTTSNADDAIRVGEPVSTSIGTRKIEHTVHATDAHRVLLRTVASDENGELGTTTIVLHHTEAWRIAGMLTEAGNTARDALEREAEDAAEQVRMRHRAVTFEQAWSDR